MANPRRANTNKLGFNDDTVAFYAGEVLLGIVHLHQNGVNVHVCCCIYPWDVVVYPVLSDSLHLHIRDPAQRP